jgi:hypothetical protein
MPDDPKPTPEPRPELMRPVTYIGQQGSTIPAWASLAVSALVTVTLAYQAWKGNDPIPGPAPVPPAPVVVPVKVEPADAIATKDGIRLDAEKTKLLCDLVNAGEGNFTLRYQPVGKAELTRTIVVSGGDKPPLPPVPPGPVPPNEPSPPVDPNTKVTAVTYVYEKDQNGIPNHVSTALNKINRESNFQIVATIFEDDSTNGPGQVPAQYKAAYDEAKKVGTPALVVVAGDRVLRSVKAPKTEQEILEAAR